ncbi:MAG: pectate lyase [Verrucomicrobiae bacterium]|nr:pectate lyase [Verrucomicrobiae bacterium]
MVSSIAGVLGLPLNGYSQTIAFPGAEGFGRYAEGGRRGDVYQVTHLGDGGKGSLRDAIVSAQGPRTIVFTVSGTIALEKQLRVTQPYLTIAGQTAPGDGITLRNYGLVIDADHVIVRYIRSRLGDQGDESDAISISGGSNIIIDHCSASWSVDEVLSDQSDTADLITVQWCMVTESLYHSIHHKGSHGMGGIIGAARQSWHHNLYAHHNTRNPKVSWRRHCQVDFRNNVIYNWQSNSCYDGSVAHMNWVNNYYKAGPATKPAVVHRIFQLMARNDSPDAANYEASLYAEGNVTEGFPEISAKNWAGGIDFEEGATEARNRAHEPFDFPLIQTQSAEEAYELVLQSAGASLPRDPVDRRIIQEVQNGTASFGANGIIDSQKDVGSWPVLQSLPAPEDTDKDGMPDFWETTHKLNPKDPSDRNQNDAKTGTTQLESYLNSLCVPSYTKAN